MKKIGVFARNLPEAFIPSFQILENWFKNNSIEVFLFHELISVLNSYNYSFVNKYTPFSSSLPQNLDALITIGGDGTILDAVSFIKNSGTPLIGINSGRLGFLANISSEDLTNALQMISDNQFSIEKRPIIELKGSGFDYPEFPFALNEITIHKQDSSSMIGIKTHVNGCYLNTYWADGLIIATSTGSTAYSLSVGGPILHPLSDSIIITPIAPHNLTVRPLILPGNSQISLSAESRSGTVMISLDHKSFIIDIDSKITISKANFTVNTIQLQNQDFYSTLRQKLLWGFDKRN